MQGKSYSFSCLICGNKDKYTPVQETILGDQKGEMIAVECGECAHTQLFPPQYDVAFYESDGQVNNVVKHYGTPQKTLFDHSFIEARRRRERFGDRGIRLSENMKLLDIGGGYGFFGGEMARSFPNAEITVLEPSQTRTEIGAVQMAENGIRPPQFQVGVLDQDFADRNRGVFDIVTMWHVLEHVPDPVGLLNLAMQIVKPDGALCVEVPNLHDDTIMLSEAFRNRSFMEEHVSYFSPATLRSTALRADRDAAVELYGYQRYGIFNYFHWIHFNKPQGASPDLFEGQDRFWLEAHWRTEKEHRLTSDALFMVMRHPA
ncbi:hypothetical protein V475_16445 [Sphingobium baderi LL03]|uniref:Methyltransferase type 12 n=2 Tax=Sphingobium baderi TaxID=1332080 RepID=T0GN16_9SPHN|nr:hypothetical protein L485_11130 [Sphingobium baderi LL03]KMS60940.1 hypothetical protein V475_16445 [Sphingobium baderi LL03]